MTIQLEKSKLMICRSSSKLSSVIACFKYTMKELAKKIGGDVLTEFVHIFEQTILMEDWLEREQYSIEEVENAKNIFHTTAITPSKERKAMVPSWPRFICYVIL